VDALLFALDATSRSVVIIEEGDRGFDFAHGAQTNPTVFVHSANQATDEWLSLTHDQTNGVISTGTGALSIGGQVTSHSLSANGDLIANMLEVNASLYADSALVTASIIYMGSNQDIRYDTNYGALIMGSTLQAAACSIFGTGTSGNYLLICEFNDRATNFGHAAQTNPTIFIQSADATDTTQWLSLAHDQTDAVIDTGSGAIKLDDNVKVEGYVQLIDIAAPGAPGAGIGRLYKKTGDDGCFWIPDAAGPEVDLTAGGTLTLNGAYDNDGGAATITVDAGDITLDLNGAYSLVLDLDGVPESGVDGFLIENPGDSDYFRVVKASPPASLSFNTQLKDADLNTDEDFDITAGGAINLSSTGKINVSGDLEMQDDIELGFGNSSDATLTYNLTQTVDTLVLGLPSSSNHVVVCQKGDTRFDFAHGLETNPSLFIHSANQDTTEWVSQTHNQTDAVKGIGKGGHVTNHASPVNLADDGSFDLPNASAGFGFVMAGDGEEYVQFTWTSAAVVTLIDNSANVVNTDTDTNLCIFDNGTAVRVRNRLGAAKDIVFDYHYTTP
jgi:hypothetical protein